MRIVNRDEMIAIESTAAEKYGFSEELIIENVGVQGADYLEAHYADQLNTSKSVECVFLIGQGNNGSDALAIARHLVNRGHTVRAFILFPDAEAKEELKKQGKLAFEYGVKITEITKVEQLKNYFEQSQVKPLVIDGILGTGFRTPLSNYLFDMINLVNDQADKIVSIDIASGIESTSGEASGTAIKANVTLAVGLPKTGNYQAEGPLYSGIIHSLNAGFPSELLKGGDKFLLSPETVAGNYAPRSKFAHKNTFGHSLVVGGSKGLSGALIMASQSALKVGTGLVTASTWAANYDELCARISSEIMTGNIPRDEESVEEIIKNFKRYDSIVIGPGLGRSSESRDVVLKVLNNFHGPVVVDADAIRVLSLKEDQKVLRDRKAPTILTPHIGEFAHFCGQEIDVVLRSPMTFLKELVDETQCSIVMKGACTYLGFPNGELYVNYFPNDGMASGGSGDVLAGILGGLLAQVPVDTNVSKIFFDKKEYFEAVCLGVVAHTLAGKHAVRSLGSRAMTAGSITEFLSPAFRELDKML